MKRKTLTLTLSILACLALIGVGFATWIVTKPANKTATGNIKVDTVTEKNYEITSTWKDNKSSLVFGYNAEGNFENPWLTNENGEAENLSVTLIATVKKGTDLADVEPTVKFAVDESKKTVWENAISEGYVTLNDPTIAKTGEGVYEITITVNWGTKFGKENPYKYFNSLPANADNTKKASDYLKVVEGLKLIDFTLTLHVGAPEA